MIHCTLHGEAHCMAAFFYINVITVPKGRRSKTTKEDGKITVENA